jgi:hypothetical protein
LVIEGKQGSLHRDVQDPIACAQLKLIRFSTRPLTLGRQASWSTGGKGL